MAKRISKISSSLKQLGEIQINDWDFMELLNKDIKELEITDSLRKFGKLRVMEWNFRDVLPVVNKLAHQEVDLVDMVKRAANYKVLDWDFKVHGPTEPETSHPDPEEIQALIVRLKEFLQYVVSKLIDNPDHARIKVREILPGVLRFRLVLVKRDVTSLIGMGGHTTSAIRNTMKAVARMNGAQLLLQILSHDEETALADRNE
jgi:predicted RNA-binding protein YlqC (UPF0109 family)